MPGQEDMQRPTLEKIEPSSMLTNSLAAILHCDVDERIEEMSVSPVMGFIYM